MECSVITKTNGLEPVSTHKYENITLNNILAISKDSSNNYLFGTSYGLIKYTSETSYQLFNAKNGFLNKYHSCNSQKRFRQLLVEYEPRVNQFRYETECLSFLRLR